MKKVSLLVAGLILFSTPLFAGEYLMNDTGETVYGLRVVFSEPVELTGLGDILTVVAPTGESTEFMFSGGSLEAWGSHWFNWEPASTSLVSHEWFADPATVEIAASDWAAYEASRSFWERNPNPTYEEIMAEIAEYPGPDEPLYEPAPDEAIWITDLDGHADIYDNDSIKINYAEWFDGSQIIKIEVYRNGIKMRFLPDTFDVLTNEDMKTFDGNPLEHSPASSHTDHAIFGYEYEFRFHGIPAIEERTAKIKPPYSLDLTPSICLNNEWQRRMDVSDAALVSELAELRDAGFGGIQIGMDFFMETDYTSEFFPQYTANRAVCVDWRLTPREADVRRMLQAAEGAGLSAELRVELWVANSYRKIKPEAHREHIRPRNVSAWFENYTELCVDAARLAEEEGAEVLCVGVELSSMQPYVDYWRNLVTDVRSVFSGLVTFAEATCNYLHG